MRIKDRLGYLFGLGLLALLLLPVPAVGGQAEEATARLVYFYAEECPHCQAAYEEIVVPLQERCAGQLDLLMVEIGTAEGYEAFVATERALTGETGEWEIPTAVLDDQFYVGEEEIRSNLEEDVECLLVAGGNSWPAISELQALATMEPGGLGVGGNPFTGGGESETCVDDEQAAACEAPNPVHLLYFFKPGCQECERVSYDLGYLEQRYPQLLIDERNVLEEAALAEWLGEEYDVPEQRRLVAPAVVVGERYLVGDELSPDTLMEVVDRVADTGTEARWAAWQPGMGRAAIVERFRSLGILPVIGAGLLDGLNPCAFATLIFFVSYLTLMDRSGREVLFVGAAFAAGVFLTYLLVGVGLWKALSALPFLTQIGRWLYGFTALLCLGLAIFSFVDFLKVRRGELDEMTLALPHSLRKRINAIIRRYRKSRGFVLGAFVTGALVSVVELACTGQVYLPTILFVLSVPELRAQGFLYLLLYNLMFIVPLIIVFVLVYFGTTSKDLTAFLQRRAAAVKLGMTLLFGLLTVWLVTLIV